MATKVEIEDVLHSWFSTVTGLTTIPQDEPSTEYPDGAPQPPALPFATYKIISGPLRVGNRDQRSGPPHGSDSVLLKYSGQYTFVVNFQTYGPGAWDSLSLAQRSLQKPTVRQSLKEKQVDVVEIDSVVDDTDYTITIDGVDNTIDSGPGASFLSIRNALKDEINNNPYIEIVASDGASNELLSLTVAFGKQYTLTFGDRLSLSSHIGAVDLAYLFDSGITDVAALLETSWEHRQSIDFTFGTTFEIDESDAGVIEKVEFTDEAITGETTLVDGS